MSSHSNQSSLDDGAYRTSMDALLNGKAVPTSPTARAFDRSVPDPTSAGAKLFSVVALILSSTLSAYTTSSAALQSATTVITLPVLHYGALAALAAIVQVRPAGSLGSPRLGVGAAEEGGRRLAMSTGVLSAVSTLSGLIQARWLDGHVWQGIEITVIPALLLLALLPGVAGCSRTSPEAVACTASASFLVVFALLGTPASFPGLLVALVRAVTEAWRLTLLKRQEMDVQTSALAALGTSCVVLASASLITFESVERTFIDNLAILAWLASSILAHIALFCALHTFTSLLTTASLLFPRNLLLLILSTYGREAIAFVATWQRMALVLAGASIAIAYTDEELSLALRERTRRIRRRLGLSTTRLGGGGYDAEAEMESPPSSPGASPSLSGAGRRGSGSSVAYTSSPSLTLAFLPFLPLLVYLLQAAAIPTSSQSLVAACEYLPLAVRTTVCPLPSSARSVDLVFAYYDEPLEQFAAHHADIKSRQFLKARDARTLVYNKGAKSEEALRTALNLGGSDEVIPLENLGREGATYLQHILLHYNATLLALSGFSPPARSPPRSRTLADHTIFQQPHPAWGHVASPRLDLLEADTGFAALGPVLRTDCGEDGRGTGMYENVRDIYTMFRGTMCPPGGQLSAWSGQFVVSRRRIMENSYHLYAALDELLEAPEGHWIHKTWGANGSGGPSNPAFGHSVERSWPIIFNCTDVRIAEECPDDVHVKEKCQCLDQ